MSLVGKSVFITGASSGIGAALAKQLVVAGADVYLFARSTDKLKSLAEEIKLQNPEKKAQVAFSQDGDVTQYDKVKKAVDECIAAFGKIDILINNAGLALGAPRRFHEQSLEEIQTVNDVNVMGVYWATHAVLNGSMIKNNSGTILNVSSITGLNAPTFPGEATYHASKTSLEGFSNVLRHELTGTDIKVLVIRPGCVETHFHEQRVGYDKELYDDFFSGFDYKAFIDEHDRQLTADEVAEGAISMLSTPLKVSINALNIMPTPQRGYINDTTWNARHGIQR
ncbi:NAD(P)-binding protein [Wallemia mellicola]|uniref:NAD(P)-binding protein n=1 Tax=Wallemia mellicola TaxID=1708541 RepID=A0A4T0U4N7_9BASI|nr:NAD(P)-binding protein [Wallemia mellicola]TIC27649.1 NAD(P)-binding protein [Wallemia mellicola]TIC72914.1 NAD(P)-binding protein [Wallemia mellicola]